MNNIMNIVKKELDKIFRNPRLIITTIILPGLLIALIYSLMGTIIDSENEKIQNDESVIYVNYQPETFKQAIVNYNTLSQNDPNNYWPLNLKIYEIAPTFDASITTEYENFVKNAKGNIKNGAINAYVYFDLEFDNKMQEYLDKDENAIAPMISVYYDPTNSASSTAFSKYNTIMEIIKNQEIHENDIRALMFTSIPVILSDEDAMSSQIMAMLLPMLLMVFVFAGGLAVGSDAIAGEKERGTISTLLMAPMKKSDIIIGKIISTTIITITSATCSFVGTIIGIKNSKGLFGEMTNFSGFGGMWSYVQIFIIVILIALFATALYLIASTIAKTTKEATTLAMPFYIISMLIGMSTMFSTSMPTKIWVYLIPLYNLTLSIKGIILGDAVFTTLHLVLVACSTLVYVFIFLWLMTKLFKNERLMFSK